MDETLEILVKIQSLTEEIRETTAEFDGIPLKIAKLEKEIEKANASFADKKNRIQEIKKTYKMKEGDIAENEEKAKKLNQQVFSVKTNEEYRAILSEIEFLKQNNKKTEDEMMKLLEEEDQLKREIDKYERETKEYVGKRNNEIEALKKKSLELEEKKKIASYAYEDDLKKLPVDVRKVYERIAKARGNAICLVTDNTCTGCYANLTHQFLNDLKKRDRIILCESCGRILIHRRK
ncbi:MAG TPA: C4-type zinc ribbon domain-containing protein [bacterium]|jgi:predicted  nucleic acid-binding Zn-ribbon protein